MIGRRQNAESPEFACFVKVAILFQFDRSKNKQEASRPDSSAT